MGSSVTLFLPLQHIQLNLHPVISPQSASALIWIFRSEVMQTVSGSHTEELEKDPPQPPPPSQKNPQHQQTNPLNLRFEHENTVDPLTSASTLGCLLASDAPIRALKYANFPLCCRIWVNFPPFCACHRSMQNSAHCAKLLHGATPHPPSLIVMTALIFRAAGALWSPCCKVSELSFTRRRL